MNIVTMLAIIAYIGACVHCTGFQMVDCNLKSLMNCLAYLNLSGVIG